ncbi:DNRLRE domain-containing protein [Paenibacillus sp. HJL G12]|uniref:DNRLRE domain-containing protein n=1 Tax=Paenibacillus dendrobii TaxID=2691084 RepID=A0A7X3IGY2_9BACL|nr:DNRLRE domain-containing protein [Paenibacillus dendrobii]MWV43081.1 DNRLRE domain-containing protein [Paenibacillus dendrobii]
MLYELNLADGIGGTANQTTYTTKNGVIVKSSMPVYSGNYNMGFLFDGKYSNGDLLSYWLTNGGDTVTLDFDFSAIINQINRFKKMTIYPRTRDESISSYRILAAHQKNDPWTEIVPRVNNTYANCPYGTAREHVLDDNYCYIRIELYRSGSWGVTLNEVKFLADVTDSYRDTNLGSLYSVPDYGWKRYDDTFSGFSYKANRPYGSIHYNAEEIKFKFYGTKVRLIYNYNQGNNGDVVYIDGIEYSTTKTTTGKSTLVFEKVGLSYGLHEVLIKTYTGSDWFSQFDAAEVGVDEYVIFGIGTQLLVPETGWQRCADTQVLYPHGYSIYNSNGTSNMHGGASRVLTRNASTLEGNQDHIKFRFFGSKLRLLACTYPDRQETMRVYIDNVDQGTFTSRFNTANIGQVVVFDKPVMDKGFHDVLIVIDPKASDGSFFFDAFDIDADGYVVGEEGAVIPVPESGWKRYEDNHPAISYFPSNGWTNANLADHSGGSVTGCLTSINDTKLSFDFIGTKFRLIISKSNTYATNIKVKVDGVDAGYFSAYDSYYYHRVAGFQKTNLSFGRHSVEVSVVTKPTNSSGYDYRFDAIDIDADGRLLHNDEVLEQSDLKVGKRIRAHYSSRASMLGNFSGLGAETEEFLPTIQAANPSGDFYLIVVDEDVLGRLVLLADRNIQGGTSWMSMNDYGLSTGIVLDKQKVPTVPILRSNISDDGTISIEVTSKVGDDYDGWKAFEGLSGSDKYRWVASNPGPASLTVKYSSAKIIKHYSLLSNTYNAAAPTKWQIMGSNDGANWYLLDERSGQQGLVTEKFFSFNNNTPYTMYRLHVLATNGYTGYFCSIDTFQLYTEDSSLANALVRLPTGGVISTAYDNEWDNYITRNSFGGRIAAGDNRVWNWSGAWTMTSNTHSNNMNNRTVRGNSLGGFSSIATTDVSAVNTGFRPLFVMFVANHGEDSLFSKINVSHRNDLQSSMVIYQDHMEYPESTMTDVTLPVTSTDWKGYSFESSGVYNATHAEWNAFDNSMTSTYPWAAPAGQNSGWLTIDYGSPLNIAGYGIGSRPSYAAQAPRNWIFYGSLDKRSWELLDMRRFVPDWAGGELRKFAVDAGGQSYRYFKWEISNPLSGNQLGVQQFELYAYEYITGLEQRKTHVVIPYREDLVSTIGVFNENGGGISPQLGDLTLPMTSNTSNGYTLKASANYTSTDYNMYLAFNNVIGSGKWSNGSSNGGKGWLAIDIVDPAVLTSYLLEAPNVSVGDMTKTWTFEGSEDGDTWDVLDSRVNEPSWKLNERREYQITKQIPAYRWFRINSTANVGGGWLTIGEIEIYGFRGSLFNQKKAFFTVLNRNDFIGTINVKPHAIMRVHADVTPVYIDQITSSIDVKQTGNVVSYISVTPHAKMRVTTAVTPPPMIEVGLSPVQDAFVRSNVPRLNYGGEQEMLVGRAADGEDFYSLVQFDTKAIPVGMKLKRAFLRFYVEQSSLAGAPVSLYEILDEWTEAGVTFASTPRYGRKLTAFVADVPKSYAEVDFLSTVQGWYDGTLDNKGMLLKVENLQNSPFVRLGTRERGSGYSPLLVVEYYDPAVKSSGYAEVMDSIIVRQNKTKDLTTKISVKSYWDINEFSGRIKVFNPDMLETFLKVVRGDMLSKITVNRSDGSNLPSAIIVSNKRDSVLDTKIKVSRDFQSGTLIVSRNESNDQRSVIIVMRDEKSSLTSAIGVSRPYIAGKIDVTSSSMIPTTITVLGLDDNKLESYITVRRNDSNDLGAFVDVWTKSELDSMLIVKSGYLASSIIVPHEAFKDMTSKIRVAERFASDLSTHIIIGHDSILFSRIVVEIADGGYAFIM